MENLCEELSKRKQFREKQVRTKECSRNLDKNNEIGASGDVNIMKSTHTLHIRRKYCTPHNLLLRMKFTPSTTKYP
jgi:hypothetical protein